MRKHIRKGSALTFFAALLCMLILMPGGLFSQETVGSLAGFIYDGDGETPVKEAVIILKAVKEEDKEYRSAPTGETGDYRMESLPVGVYIAAVRVKSGKIFATLSVVKVEAGKRLIRSFYLTPERPLAALWKNPCGIAMVLSGTALIGKGITKLVEEDEVSPTQL